MIYVFYRTLDMARGSACPVGWHLPDTSEWSGLVKFVGDSAANLKSNFPNWNGTDDYGFSALPGGRKFSDGISGFEKLDEGGYWWTKTRYTWNHPYEGITYTDDWIYFYIGEGNEVAIGHMKDYKISVRCVQN
jgi:uncharacterized protein (TIGR02145 family)